MTSLNRLVLSCFLVSLYLVRLSESYFVLVDADAEECFFDKAENGVKMSLMFETIEGGFYDIDVKITGPDGKPIHQGEKETSGKYTFASYMTGTYTYCFSNKMSSMTPKVVMFTMDIGDAPTGTMGAVKESEVGHTKLEEMIRELSGTLTSIKHEQEYMHMRDKIHRKINENTNSRVVMWSTFEALVLIVMTVGQVYYLKRFFEVKRIV